MNPLLSIIKRIRDTYPPGLRKSSTLKYWKKVQKEL